MALQDRGGAPTAGNTSLATTAYVDSADALKAPLASPALTGTPTAPTAATSDSSTKVATTAYVQAALTAASALTQYMGATSSGSPSKYQRIATMNGGSSSGGAHLTVLVAGIGDYGANPRGVGILDIVQRGTNPSGIFARMQWIGPAPSVGTFYTVSTGAQTLEVWFVTANFQMAPHFEFLDTANATILMDPVTATAPTGFVVVPSDVTAAVDSPAFTGTPTAPTQATSANDTTIATTAFVKALGYAQLAGASFGGAISATSFTGTVVSSSVTNPSAAMVLSAFSGTALADLHLDNDGSPRVYSNAILNRAYTVASALPGSATSSVNGIAVVTSSGTLGQLQGPLQQPDAYTRAVTSTSGRAVFVASNGYLGNANTSARRHKNVHGETGFDDARLEAWVGFPTVLFDYKNDENHVEEIGVIAEDAFEAGFDKLVLRDDRPDSEEYGLIDGFAYERMGVWNRMAIKRLLERVVELERRLAA